MSHRETGYEHAFDGGSRRLVKVLRGHDCVSDSGLACFLLLRPAQGPALRQSFVSVDLFLAKLPQISSQG